MLTDLKEVEKFLKLCRKQGVDSVTFEGLIVKFGELPQKVSEVQSEEIPTDSLTPDELIYYAVENAGMQ